LQHIPKLWHWYSSLLLWWIQLEAFKMSQCSQQSRLPGRKPQRYECSKARVPTLTEYVPTLTWSSIAEWGKELHLSSKTHRNYPDKKLNYFCKKVSALLLSSNATLKMEYSNSGWIKYHQIPKQSKILRKYLQNISKNCKSECSHT
jgi:hypothetical protein